jgi:GTP-binding protein EngB required for normal cell division
MEFAVDYPVPHKPAVDDSYLAPMGKEESFHMRQSDGAVGPLDAASLILDRIATVARSLGANDVATDAAELSERVSEGRFYVACVGEFKRGKSTLLNALVGQPVLPAGIVPVTAVPTVLRYGSEPGARVRLRGTEWRPIGIADLEQYVSEERNPENAKGVEAAEVFVPSSLLAGGMSLVDTPGIGSVFTANTKATEAFVPHIDAAIAVIGVDPPLSGDELVLLERVAKQAPNVIVVMNKSDRHNDSERAQAVGFAKRVLAGRLASTTGDGAGRPVQIFHVSATTALHGDTSAFEWNQFVGSLGDLEAQSKPSLVRATLRRGTARLSDALRREVAEQRAALARPIDESERRVEGAATGERGRDAPVAAVRLPLRRGGRGPRPHAHGASGTIPRRHRRSRGRTRRGRCGTGGSRRCSRACAAPRRDRRRRRDCEPIPRSMAGGGNACRGGAIPTGRRAVCLAGQRLPR